MREGEPINIRIEMPNYLGSQADAAEAFAAMPIYEARVGEPIVPLAAVRAAIRAILDIGRRYR